MALNKSMAAGAACWVRGIAAALIVFGLTTVPLVAADKRPFASSDYTSLRSATPIAISPDGKTILFDVQFFDEKGPAKNEWHIVPVAGGAALKLDLPQKFAPSGFTRDGALFGDYRIDNQTQLAIVPMMSAKPTIILTLPRGGRVAAISPDGANLAAISPDGGKIAVLSDTREKDNHDQHQVVENDEASLYVFDLHSNGGGWWCSDLRSISDFAWSKDSKRLAVTTQLPKLGNHDAHSMLHVCGEDGSRQLADVPTRTIGVAWSADETELVFASTKAPTLTAEHVWTVALSGGAPVDRTPDLDGTATTVMNHHGAVLVELHRGVRTEIDSFEGGKLTPLLHWPDGATIGMPAANPFPDTPDVVAVGVGDPDHSNNVAVAKAGQLQKITFEGDAQLDGINLGETKVVHWTSKEGVKLEGIATFPPGYTSAKRYPFLVFPHGGPEANDQLVLDPRARYIAAKNYVVLRPEYRGSTGYGTAHLAAIYQHFGDRAYRDVDSATDFAIAQGWADPARLAIFGWSAGGFMTAWTVTQTHRYKAAIEGAGITDWLSFIPTSDAQQTDYDARLQEKDPGPMLKFSAVMFADKVTTPLLILHGSADVRVPIFQSSEFYALLKERGKTVRMVTYPGSPHNPRIAEQRRDVLDEVGSWLDKYNP
jgi:dipeptidyl aminopeptidase/acylaminoacyl peptidase